MDASAVFAITLVAAGKGSALGAPAVGAVGVAGLALPRRRVAGAGLRMGVRLAAAVVVVVAAVAAGVAAPGALRFEASPRELVVRPVNSMVPPTALAFDRVWTMVMMN